MEELEEKGSGIDLAKLMTLGFIGLNLIVCVLGVYLVYSSTLAQEKPSLSDEEMNRELASYVESLKGDPVLYTMDTFTTNLDGVPRRMIRVELSLEMLDYNGFEEVVTLGPQARDSVIRILNGKRFGDIETVQGKLRLKNEIISQVNAFLDKGVVRNVYFSNFAVQ